MTMTLHELCHYLDIIHMWLAFIRLLSCARKCSRNIPGRLSSLSVQLACLVSSGMGGGEKQVGGIKLEKDAEGGERKRDTDRGREREME